MKKLSVEVEEEEEVEGGDKCITIEVAGGCVIDVSGIPDNYTYIIKDNDTKG